ncbi:uncharacterized protein LOC124590782 isoform X1 [Schistocerca americana]|uniref:uncharacterized protein LOC124590782 isoform X1 n=1 Tax=Schistocerca americana TaxID=7009 RepID=UPI001F4F9086|nr:uncharacterized protein LOC124590782 isoform X1 [Schistocerca americana]
MTDLSTLLRSLSSKKGLPELITLSGCEVCGDAHPTKSCPLLAEAKHVQDAKIPSRARLTLPPNLAVLNVADGTSVIAKADFGCGAMFGPLQALHSAALPEGVKFPLKIFGQTEDDSYYLNTAEEDSCNWMCLVSPAASADEQNLICYQMNEKIFFILLKDIKAGEELKVWYAPNYAVRMVASAYKIALNTSSKKANEHVGHASEGDTVYSTKHKMKKNREKRMETDTLLDTEIMQKVAEQLPAKRLGACRVPEKWRCRKCGSEETSVVAYAKHLMKHFKPAFSDTVKPIQCHLCKKTFGSEKLLVKHKVIRHGAVVQRPVLLANIREEDTGDGQSSTSDKMREMDRPLSSQSTNFIKISNDENTIKEMESKSRTLYTQMTRHAVTHNPGIQNVPVVQAYVDTTNPLVSNTATGHDVKAVEFLSEQLKGTCSLTLDDIKSIAAVKDNNTFAQELLKIINEKPSLETADILASNNTPNSELRNVETGNRISARGTKYDFELRDLEGGNGILNESGKAVPEISSLATGRPDYEFLIVSSNENKISGKIKPYVESTNQFQLDSTFSDDQELCLHQPSSSLNAVVVPEDGNSYQLILNENCSEGSGKELECTSLSLSKCYSDKVAESVINMLETDWELVTGSDDDSSALMGMVPSSDKNDKSASTNITSSSLTKCSPEGDKFPFNLHEVSYPSEIIQTPKNKNQMSDIDCSSTKFMESSSGHEEQPGLIAVSFSLDDVAMMPSDGSCTNYMFNLNNTSGKEELISFSANNMSFEEKEHNSQCNDKGTNSDVVKLKSVTEQIGKNTQDLSAVHSEPVRCVSSVSLKITEEDHQHSTVNRDVPDFVTPKEDLSHPQEHSSQHDSAGVETASENYGNVSDNQMKQNPKNIVTSSLSFVPEEKKCHLNSAEDHFDSSNQSFFEAVFDLGITSNCLEKFPKNDEQPSDIRSNSLMKDLDTVLLGDNVQDSQISSDKKQVTSDSTKKHYVLDTGPPYNCDICDKEFHKAIYLYRHLKKHAGEFVCVSCLTVFARKENLVNHSCFGADKSNFLVCTFCHKTFSTKLMLRKHMVKHIAGGFSCTKYLNKGSEKTATGNQSPPQPKPLRCPICRREFRYRNLCRHLQQHRKLRPCRCCGRSLPGNIALHEAYCSQDNILQSGKEAECPDCKEKFSDVVLFRLHIFQHTHPYICQTCKQAFRSDKDKCCHQCKKWSEKCPICPQELSSLVELEQHIVSHELPQFHCFDCGRSFLKPDALFAHACDGLDVDYLLEENSKISKPKISLICEVCGEVFHSNASLSTHKQLHGEPRFQCEICHKIFQRSDTLHAHLAVHREAQIPCPVCQKKVKTKKSLAVHMRQHMGTRLFKCDQCGKGFNQKINLNKHLQVHEDIDKRKQTCRYCDKTFLNRDSLKIHELKHTQGQPHSCPLCNKAFVKEHQLRNHIKRLHAGQILSCPFCPLTFRHRSSLSRHLERRHAELRDQWNTPNFLESVSAIAQESLSCPYCSQTFKNNNSLYHHLEKSHGDNRTEWSIPNLLQTVTVAPQDTEDITGVPQGTEIILTVSDLPVSVENHQPETLTSQHLPESESQNSANIAVENAFILEDGTIIQGNGHDVGELVLYVLDNEDVCINPELQSM